MPSPFSVCCGHFHLYRCLQIQVFPFLFLQWPVSSLPLPIATCLLLPLSAVASITSTVAYRYMPSPFSAYSGQYHLYRCLKLHAFSFLYLLWPVLPLPLPTVACLLLSLATVVSVTFVVSYSYMPSPPNAQRSVSPLLLSTATAFVPTTCSYQYQFSVK